jgi:CRP/FNR family transcriptional regulator, cyclic AMP receptor protein
MQEIESSLAEHPFFQGLNKSHLALISKFATLTRFESGQYLFREGESSDNFHLIQSGKVALELFVPAGGSITIQTIGPGELIGWSWLVSPFKKHFDAKAIDTVSAFKFDAKGVRELCEKDPKLGYEILKRLVKVLGQRLHATRQQLLQVYGASR